jgi:hypothetical protein
MQGGLRNIKRSKRHSRRTTIQKFSSHVARGKGDKIRVCIKEMIKAKVDEERRR